MTSLNISESDIPDLSGKVALIAGGTSGIGLATACILSSHGAKVHVLGLHAINTYGLTDSEMTGIKDLRWHCCDVTSWTGLREIFENIGRVDIAIANAGVTEDENFLTDTFDKEGKLEEPGYKIIDVNYRAVLNIVKLSLRAFRQQGPGGSLVLTSSSTAYSPEQGLPLYGATKTALIGLVRSLRPTMRLYGATINAVAPAGTLTKMLPVEFGKLIQAAGVPLSTAYHVGLAVAFSAVATQSHQVDGYGRDSEEQIVSPGRWNGRVILTVGEKWTEVEGPTAVLKEQWLGEWNTKTLRDLQCVTDLR